VTDLDGRKRDLTRRWRVSVERWIDTPCSAIAFGERDGQPVVLKVVKTEGDEWNSGAVVAAFEGRRVVRAIDHEPGAVLLERAVPGTSLVDVVRAGRDEEAIDVLAGMMTRTSGEAPPGCATAEQWGCGFAKYRGFGNTQIDATLVDAAEAIYFDLCASQREPRLLHGDLQHHNVLFDESRGWLTIDPKGVVAEREFEVGPFLRNPHGVPELYSDSEVVARRLTRLCWAAHLDFGRALRWAFALAVLSAIWEVDDNGLVQSNCPALKLADAIHPLLP
jgi:streptomycin 6-kinase